jgi:hypothetical protein
MVLAAIAATAAGARYSAVSEPAPSRAELRVDGLRAAAAPLLGKRMIGMDEGYVIGDWTAAAPALTWSAVCPVNSWNEWDPLEEDRWPVGWSGGASISCECHIQ